MREFRQKHGRTGERYWQIGFESAPGKPVETIVTAWGAITKAGKHKEHGRTSDRPGPKGKRGTKAFMSAQDNACFNTDRAIRKKLEEGYAEVGLDGRPVVGGDIEIMASDRELDLTTGLPKNLCFSKPVNSVSESRIQKLSNAGKLIYTRKVHGQMVIAQIGPDQRVSLYSRRMDSLDEHFPHLVHALTDLNMPANSIMLLEAFLGEGKKQHDFERVGSVMRSKPDRAIKLQQEQEWMKFYLFRIPVWKGQYVEQEFTCEEMLYMIENGLADIFLGHRGLVASGKKTEEMQVIYPVEIFEGTYPEALAVAEEEGYEGWVAYVRDGCLLETRRGSDELVNKSFSFHGKPDRPRCCFKVKVDQEDDFIARWDPDNDQGTWGTGKNSERVGTLSLYQYGEGSDEIYCCEVGSGLTDAKRDELADPSLFPQVVQIRYQERKFISEGAKSNALILPRVAAFREDKGTPECFCEKLTSPVD